MPKPALTLVCVCLTLASGFVLAGCAGVPLSPPPTPSAAPTLTPTPTHTPTITPSPTATPGPGLDDLLVTPNALAAANHLDDALVYYSDLATLYPHSPQPLLLMAGVAQRQNDVESANKYFEAATVIDPSNRDSLRLWAIFLEQQGQYAALADVYDRMVALDPDDPDLRVARAMANARLGDSQAATADLSTAMALDPNREYAWLNVAGAASGARRYQTAIDVASAGLNSYPESSGLLMTRGLANLSLKQIDTALADFKAAAAAEPSNALALHWQGRSLIAQGKFAEAAAILQRAADLGQASGVDGVNLSYESMSYAADALARSDIDSAFEYLAKQVIQHGSRDGLLMGYGLVRWRQGNIPLAVSRFNGLVDTGFVPALFWRGMLLADQGQNAKAVADLKAFLALRFSGPDVESARDTLKSLGANPDK